MYTVLDVTDGQLCLQEEVELAIRQTHGHVHNSGETNDNDYKCRDAKKATEEKQKPTCLKRPEVLFSSPPESPHC